ETTTAEQRVRFLDVLFAVADGDGRVSYEETEEIRLIAKMLKLTHRQFIDAKLKIPSEQRSS
ncbi:MAG: TerB family tellurite resistance protein, partial [Anaerolineales bacterium]